MAFTEMTTGDDEMSEREEASTIPELLERATRLLDEAAALEISSEQRKDLLGIAKMVRDLEIPDS